MKVSIREVAPRDGLQNEEPIPTGAKVRLIDALSGTGVKRIEAVSFVHPVTTFFPHANGGELFVWAGISAGVLQADPEKYPVLAILYFLTGIVVIFFRGFITEWITRFLIRRQGLTEVFDGYDREFAEARAARLAKKAA